MTGASEAPAYENSYPQDALSIAIGGLSAMTARRLDIAAAAGEVDVVWTHQPAMPDSEYEFCRLPALYVMVTVEVQDCKAFVARPAT